MKSNPITRDAILHSRFYFMIMKFKTYIIYIRIRIFLEKLKEDSSNYVDELIRCAGNEKKRCSL